MIGRRILTPDNWRNILGRVHNRAKRQGERTDLTSDQIDPKLQTADRLAAQYGTSAATVKRAGKFAAEVERTPALYLANRLYQDPTRAPQLVAEADPPHPAFMPPAFRALAS